MHSDPTSRALLWLAPVVGEEKLGPAAVQLSDDERRRCERIGNKAARERFLTGRAMIRLALSEAVGGDVAPFEWHIRPGVNGKPFVAGPHPSFGISIAHSEDMVAVAVCPDEDVGVDIECIDEVAGAVVDEVLSDSDREKLDACGPEDRRREFVRLWTMKEAYSKWTGEGVGMDFAGLDFDWTPGRPDENIQAEGAGIQVRSFALDKEYCVALTRRSALAPAIRFDRLETKLSAARV